MDIQILTVPYDSGQKAMRMGCGPARIEAEALPTLRGAGHTVAAEAIEDDAAAFPQEVGTTFKLHRRVAVRVREVMQSKRFPLLLTGNCGTSAIGTMAALSDVRTGVVWFDAHGDFNTPETSTSGFLDGMSLSVVTGHCWSALASTVPNFAAVPEERVIHAGGRALDAKEAELMQKSSLCVITPERLNKVGLVKALGPGLDYIGMNCERVYLHVDMDILDPSEAPANHYAVSGGLPLADLLAGIDVIGARLPIVAAGVTSYDPAGDPDGKALRAAVEIVKKITAVGKIAG